MAFVTRENWPVTSMLWPSFFFAAERTEDWPFFTLCTAASSALPRPLPSSTVMPSISQTAGASSEIMTLTLSFFSWASLTTVTLSPLL